LRVLFDHNVPHKLRAELLAVGRHEIVTVAHLGWSRLKNGELLQAAEVAGFEAFVTGDRTLVAEQNLALRRLAILVLSTNNWPLLKGKTSLVLQAIDQARAATVSLVDCGEYRRAERD
jgi:hypothetical protein